MVLVWNRIGDDRIAEIEARRRFYDERERLGVSNVTLGDGTYPSLEEHWHAAREAETALRVDFKSMFVFGETLIASYIVMSEQVWEAPDAVNHNDGPTRFISSLRHAQEPGKVVPPFLEYMDVLLEKLSGVDEMLGFTATSSSSTCHPTCSSPAAGGSLAVRLTSTSITHGGATSPKPSSARWVAQCRRLQRQKVWTLATTTATRARSCRGSRRSVTVSRTSRASRRCSVYCATGASPRRRCSRSHARLTSSSKRGRARSSRRSG